MMGITFFPVNAEIKYKSKFGPFLASLSELYKDETTIILSENFRSLFNLNNLEEKSPDTFLQALVFTAQNPPLFLAFLPSDHPGQRAKHSSSPDTIKTYMAKLVRSLTSAIHTFSEESIAIATVIVDSDDLSNLKEKIDEATNRLPASRRGMTAALYDHLVVAATASLGLGAIMAGSDDSDLAERLVDDLKCNKGRMRRQFSTLGNVILHLEDVQNPRISSSLTSYNLHQTLDLTKPTLVVRSDWNRKSLEKVSTKLEWDVVMRLAAETSQPYDNMLMVNLEDKEGKEIANLVKAATTVVRIYGRVKASPSSQSAPPVSDPSDVSHQRLRSGRSETPTEAKQMKQPAKRKRRSKRTWNSFAKRSKLSEQRNANASYSRRVLRPMTIAPQDQRTSTARPHHPTKSPLRAHLKRIS